MISNKTVFQPKKEPPGQPVQCLTSTNLFQPENPFRGRKTSGRQQAWIRSERPWQNRCISHGQERIQPVVLPAALIGTQAQAAVDHEDLPCHVTRIIAGQEGHHEGDFFR